MSFPKRPHKPKPKKQAPAAGATRGSGAKSGARPGAGKSTAGKSGTRKTDARKLDTDKPERGSRFEARKADAGKPERGSKFGARKADAGKPERGGKFGARKADARKFDTGKPERGSKFDARKADAGKPERGGKFGTRKADAGKPERGSRFGARKADAGKPERGSRFDARKADAGKPERGSRFDARTSDTGKPERGGKFGARRSEAAGADGGNGRARGFSASRPKVGRPAAGRPSAGRFDASEPIDSKPPARKRFERPPAQLSSEPHPGMFLLTTREGAEQDLVDELALLRVVDPPARVLAPALVLAPKVPKRDKAPVDLTFARQGFPIVTSVRAHDLEEIANRVARSLRGQLERAKQYGLHVWVPDSTLGNPLAALATELEEKLAAKLETHLPEARRVDDTQLRKLASLPLAQVCLMDPERAVAGVSYSNAALSLARGGRTRVRVTGDFPSRAARKLEEALAWLGVEPTAGDLCVDLGAAPGGWTYVLAERRARVIAIDPAKLRPEILARKGVRHVQASAFTYKPEEPVDWLFSDMAWRPLEAAALLAKWGRNKWARMLVSNIKLPMTKKAEILARVRHILETEGGWKHVKAKQLYHDRDEITLTAHLG